jgi:phage shock protein C
MGIAEDLDRLQGLRERGALSQGEFERAKARILAGDDAAPPAGGDSFIRQLARSRSDRILGGVCGGLGRHTELPAWAWRLIFCLVTLYFGSGVLFYVLLWIFLPEEDAAQP